MLEVLSCLECICAVRDPEGEIIGCLDYASPFDCFDAQTEQDREWHKLSRVKEGTLVQ